MRAPARLLTYAALLAGATMFLLPFAWMLSTALKPIEQTTAVPPEWLPRRYFAGTGAERHEVKIAAQVTSPSVWAIPAGAEIPVTLPIDDVHDGVWSAGYRQVPVRVLTTVPASPDHPWDEVVDVRSGHHDVLPAQAIEAAVSPRWSNFPGAIRAMGAFWRYFGNTVLLCVLNVVGTVLSSALAAYGFSRVEWRGRDRTFALLLGTMMIPFPVVMVPLYGLFRALGWVGTMQPLWVGAFCAGAFNVFLLRQFFRTIPRELSEAARIDGCGEFRIFWQIVLPLCRPALIVVALFTFLGTWNDFLGPLIYLTDERDFTLALALQSMQTKSGLTDWHYLMAASTLVILPVIALFLVAQRHFVEGIALTGGKT
ncbi:MAG TPA: carbohydrate ABC transporter permease [Opitutaceae bacterium]|nr:carbohydrate ABC transporter permease [Opitutaceae bacterium]